MNISPELALSQARERLQHMRNAADGRTLAYRFGVAQGYINALRDWYIAKLGATREGVLRRHKRRADGTFRDTVVFSVLRDEWPAVRELQAWAGNGDRPVAPHEDLVELQRVARGLIRWLAMR